MKPIVHGLEPKWKGRVAFFNANTDTPDGRELAQQFECQAIPLFIFIGKDGKVAERIEGGTTAATLETNLKKIAP